MPLFNNIIDYEGHPEKSYPLLDRTYASDKVLVIEDIFSSISVYSRAFQDILDIFKYAFEDEKVRNRTINFVFKRTDSKIHNIQLRHLLSNMILWKSFISIDKVDMMSEEYIFDFKEFNITALRNYIDSKLIPINDNGFKEMNAMVDDICHSIICISHAFCLLMGLSVSIYDIYDLEKRNPEFSALINSEIDTTKDIADIEAELNDKTGKIIDIMTKDTENDFHHVFSAGNILKPAQFKEFILKVGFKANMEGNTIPIMIDGSFLNRGLEKPSWLYINAVSGRKASMLSKLSMGLPGAFSRKLCQATTSASYLRKDNEMCDSHGSVTYYIKDDLFLLLLNGRYYYDDMGKMHLLNYNRDKHLIDRYIRFRSPETCNSKEGICRYCYGHLFDNNKDMFSVGALAALKLSEPIGQGILSSKHSQDTKSKNLTFAEGFNDVFETDSSEIILKDDSELDIPLFLRLKEVFVEEYDDTDLYYTYEADIVDSDSNLMFKVEEVNKTKLYLSENLVKLYKERLKRKDTLIDLELFEDAPLFTIEVKNKELTEALKVFEGILNNKDRKGTSDLNEISQSFAEVLIGMGIKYDLVHAEAVLRSIIRKKSNILEYPDFSIGSDHRDVQLIKLNDSLYYNPSALVSLSYGYLRKQLLSVELYNKTATSHLDPLFMSRLAEYIPAE